MAATILNMFQLFLFWCIEFSVLISVVSAATSTTTPASTSTAASTVTTSTTPTTTTVTTTTTRPTVPTTNIPLNTDIGKCPCDLTGNACDVNCCCDPECTENDKLVFSQCLPSSYVLDDKLCFNKNVFLFENGPSTSGESGDLFCIYYDNDQKRNYYSNPSLVTSEAEFLKYAAAYGKFSFQSPAPPQLTSQFNNYYKSGDPLYVVYENQAFSYLGLPTSLSTSVCSDSNPAAYLIDASSQCNRLYTISSFSADCINDLKLKADTYFKGFRIVKDPFLLKPFNSSTSIQDPVVGSPNLASVTDLYNNSFTTEILLGTVQCINGNGMKGSCLTNTTQTPYFNTTDNRCYNVVVEVNYRFELNGTFGIQKAYVDFVFQNIDKSKVSQTFSTKFTKVISTSSTSVQRSGNPGYQIGQPIIAGKFNASVSGTTEKIELLPEDRLSLMRPSASGDCTTITGQTREPVLFGQDMRTGCFISINTTSTSSVCQELQQEIMNAIEGSDVPPLINGLYAKNNRYVAMFGNSEVTKTGDWVEIFFPNRPVPPSSSSSSCTLSLGANIQILYAKIGALPNPQPKIIGVSFIYDDVQQVVYQCTGPYCQPGSSSLLQKVEISSSVTFIDVSLSPQAVEGKYPTVAVRLPYDFFYPFLTSSGQCHPTFSQTSKFMIILLILTVWSIL
ncbi:hypothetical protein BgiMline_023814 [Biomphalaria glabrata]|nr:tectonic-3 [Biomphalaria glabrata]